MLVCSPLNTSRSILLLFSYCADVASVTLHLLSLSFVSCITFFLSTCFYPISHPPALLFGIAIYFFLLSSPAVNLLSPTASLYHYKVSFDGFCRCSTAGDHRFPTPMCKRSTAWICWAKQWVCCSNIHSLLFYWSHAVGHMGCLSGLLCFWSGHSKHTATGSTRVVLH